ncbi:Universal stress protein family protein [Roseovarius albus]|uniref:Universal stress protein family protein n=1 Tax=Roseovarius albus TaxID=1247867 RepID=A0A1X7A1U1_9RHOB|nr:universal stress protein [Roseovarius albus]SLN66183.1 Universal stress protein family protein [Roseovarius albus]
MSVKFVVGYDGSVSAKRALNFAVNRAETLGGSVVVAHVLEWAPYSFLTPSELDERHKRRQKEISRAKKAVIDPVMEEVSGKGISISSEIRYGKIADILSEIAKETEADQLVIARSSQDGLSARVFGSVANSLVQSAPVPCTVVP